MNKKNAPKSPRILQVRKDGAYDCVYVNKEKIRLGRTGTPEADDNFRRIQIQVLTDPACLSPKPQQVSVDVLGSAYLDYAEMHDPGHYGSIKTAIGILLQHYAGQPVDILDTRHFLFLQDKFVERGVSRQYCNALMGYIQSANKFFRNRLPTSFQTLKKQALGYLTGGLSSEDKKVGEANSNALRFADSLADLTQNTC